MLLCWTAAVSELCKIRCEDPIYNWVMFARRSTENIDCDDNMKNVKYSPNTACITRCYRYVPINKFDEIFQICVKCHNAIPPFPR